MKNPSPLDEGDNAVALGQNLGRRTLSGTFWLLAGKFFRQGLFLGRAVILGRLLSPYDFGLAGIGLLAIQLLGILTYSGFGEALIQRPRLSPRVLHTAWWVTLVRSTLIAAVLWFCAPIIARYFQEPAATTILQGLAVVQFLGGLPSIGVTLLQKDMKFRDLFQLDAWGLAMDFLVAVIAALIWRNAWALVLGAGAGTLTRVIVSYVLYPYQPRLVFDGQAARELFHFGRWLLLGATFYFLISKGTDMMSGMIFGAAALGLYQMASRFALLPSNHFADMFHQVLFPAYSLMQDDPEKLKTAFLKVLQVATLIIFPLCALMAAAVGPVLPLFLGAKWQEVVSLVPGLVVGGAVQALLLTGAPLFYSAGKPNRGFAMDFFSALGIFLCVYPLSHLFGLQGLSWSYALGILLGIPLWWRFVRQQVQVSGRDLLTCIVPSLVASVLLAGFIWLPVEIYQVPLTNWSALGWIALLGVVGSVFYLLLILLTESLLPGYQPLKASRALIGPIWRGKVDAPSQ
jgi:PST family polysaccharide transporter/lipopolysaccharide exporter